MNIVKEEHYGEMVWTNKEMDELRKTECLCLHCGNIDNCYQAKKMYWFCKTFDLAMCITRCPKCKSE